MKHTLPLSIVLLLVHLIFVVNADAQGGRGIFGSRRLKSSSGIFGVTHHSNFHASSPAGRISRNFLRSDAGRAYGVRRAWSSRIYSRDGLSRNYFGNQTIPNPSDSGIRGSIRGGIESASSGTQKYIEDLPDEVQSGLASGPGFDRF